MGWLDRVRDRLTRWQQDRARRLQQWREWETVTDLVIYRPRSLSLRLGRVQVWIDYCPFQVFISTNAPLCAACNWTTAHWMGLLAWQPDRRGARWRRVRLCALCAAALLDPGYRDDCEAGVDWARLERLLVTPPSRRPWLAEPFITATDLLHEIDEDLQAAGGELGD